MPYNYKNIKKKKKAREGNQMQSPAPFGRDYEKLTLRKEQHGSASETEQEQTPMHLFSQVLKRPPLVMPIDVHVLLHTSYPLPSVPIPKRNIPLTDLHKNQALKEHEKLYKLFQKQV
jgi:hypothetical protein